MGSISAHTRPVESLAAYLDTSACPPGPPRLVLFTADTMGVIKAWDVVKDTTDGPPIWRSTLLDDLTGHRTRINEIVYGNGLLFSGKKSRDSDSKVQLTLISFSLSSASADETIQLFVYPPPALGLTKKRPITHTRAFRAVLPIYLHPELDSDAFPYLLAGSGDCIRIYDISSIDEVEFMREIEGHWHDVTHLRTWIQRSGDGAKRDVWIVSGSLDGTLRKWKLSGMDGVSALW
jgi:WD40 repeat protein